MFFHGRALEEIREKIKADSYFGNGMAQIRITCAKADPEVLAQTLNTLVKRAAEFGGGKIMRCGNFSRNLSILAVKLAFLYRMEPDAALLQKLRQIISLLTGLSEWRYQGILDGWISDLWTGDIGANVAIAYDSIRSELLLAERAAIEKALYEKSFRPIYTEWLAPETHCHALDSMGHNWWSVCVAGAGVVAVVLGEEAFERFSDGLCYETCLHQIVDGFRQWFSYPGNILQNKKGNFGEDGDYIEYVGYLVYAFSNLIVFEELLVENNPEQALLPKSLMQKIPDYYLSFLHIKEEVVLPADFGDTPNQIETAPFLFKLAKDFDRADFTGVLRKLCPEISHPYDLYFAPILTEQLVPVRAPIRAGYAHSGYGVLRSGYSPEDFCFVIKTGESWNHNHRDVGSFELSAKNFCFITDSGTCSYSNPLYQSYYVTPRAHNVVLFNGVGQPQQANYEGTKFEGKLPIKLFAEDYSYLLADCTGPYANIYRRFYRHIIQTDGILILVDDIATYEDGRLDWLLHYNGTASISENEVNIQGGANSLRLVLNAGSRLHFTKEEGHLHALRETAEREEIIPEATYLCASAETVQCRQKFIAVFVLPGEGSENVQVDHTRLQDMTEISITKDGRRSRLLLNDRADGRVMHRNASNCYGNVETDGFLTYLRYDKDDSLTAVSAHNTSLLRVDGKPLFSSLLKCDVVVKYPECSVTAQASMDTEGTFWNSSGHEKCIKLSNE